MTKPPCKSCGKVHEKCAAHKRGTNKTVPCGANPPSWANVCTSHGAYGRLGKEGTRKWLAEQAQEEKARELMETYGKPVDVDPINAFLGLISWTAGHVEWLRQKVQETSPDDLVWGDSEYTSTPDGVTTKEVASPSVWLKLYGEERDRLARYIKDAHTIGIEERRIRLAETYADHVLAAFRVLADRILSALDRLGWERSELEEVWPVMIQEEIPNTLRDMQSRLETDTRAISP